MDPSLTIEEMDERLVQIQALLRPLKEEHYRIKRRLDTEVARVHEDCTCYGTGMARRYRSGHNGDPWIYYRCPGPEANDDD